MKDYMKNALDNISGYTKIYSSSVDGFNTKTFHEKCKNYIHTIILVKSNFGKILGGYLPMKWENFGNVTITGGQSFVFFYDEDELRVCT